MLPVDIELIGVEARLFLEFTICALLRRLPCFELAPKILEAFAWLEADDNVLLVDPEEYACSFDIDDGRRRSGLIFLGALARRSLRFGFKLVRPVAGAIAGTRREIIRTCIARVRHHLCEYRQQLRVSNCGGYGWLVMSLTENG